MPVIEKGALDAQFAAAYEELRRVAHGVRRGGHDSLTTTALVHEVYLKLVPRGVPANDRAHFKLLVARAMRQLLIDAARGSTAGKRGGGVRPISLAEEIVGVETSPERLLDLDTALQELERADPRRAAIVLCRFYGGLDVEETAAALRISTATVKRDWRLARAWLAQGLE
jgi:RNA polymerase sigma factor (TIGR02999 family)